VRARDPHLNDELAARLMERADDLFVEDPEIEVLAAKHP
jgi:hypothetical protein